MNFLDGIPMLESLSEQDKQNLALFCQEKTVAKGEYLFNEGEEATAMYIIKSGSFEVVRTVDGVLKTLGVVGANEMLGEMALFTEVSRRMAGAIAKEDAKLVTILSFSIKELTQKNPELLEKIKTIVDERILENKTEGN